MTKRVITSLALTLTLLSSCAKSEGDAISLVNIIKTRSLSESVVVAEEARVTCAKAEECPEAVGLYAGANADSVFTCTAFLVAPNIVATNSHCVPSAVKLMPSLCAERVHVAFAATKNSPAENFACGELLGQSLRPNEISPDLALIRLAKPTNRSFFPKNSGGVAPDQALRAYKMNPGINGKGKIVAEVCVSVAGSYRFPLYTSARDSVLVAGDCNSIPGNSGSPLVNEKGEAVAVIQAELRLAAEKARDWRPYLLAGETFAPLALATSFRCLKGDGWNWNEECVAIDFEELVRPSIVDFLDSLSPKLESIARAFKNEIFSWEAVPTRKLLLEREYRLEPHCFGPKEDWLMQFSNSRGPALPERAAVNFSLPKIRAAIGFNRYMQVSAAVSVIGTEIREFELHPKMLWDSGLDEILFEGRKKEIGYCETTAD